MPLLLIIMIIISRLRLLWLLCLLCLLLRLTFTLFAIEVRHCCLSLWLLSCSLLVSLASLVSLSLSLSFSLYIYIYTHVYIMLPANAYPVIPKAGLDISIWPGIASAGRRKSTSFPLPSCFFHFGFSFSAYYVSAYFPLPSSGERLEHAGSVEVPARYLLRLAAHACASGLPGIRLRKIQIYIYIYIYI